MKPILKYPGAKWQLAPWIIEHLPRGYPHYVEPFCGSAAVFFNLPWRPKHAVLNDLSGDIVNLFRVIRTDGERLAALIEMTPWAREEYRESYEPTDDSLERARRFLVRVHQGHGTDWVKGGKTFALSPVRSADTSGEWYRTQHWRNMPPRIISMIERLRDVEVESRSALDVIKWATSPKVLIYADPPYVTETRQAKLYQHEMTDDDHRALLEALDAHPGPVVLSGYACALYDERLTHWHRVTTKAQAEKGNTRTEVLWLNEKARPAQVSMFAQEAI